MSFFLTVQLREIRKVVQHWIRPMREPQVFSEETEHFTPSLSHLPLLTSQDQKVWLPFCADFKHNCQFCKVTLWGTLCPFLKTMRTVELPCSSSGPTEFSICLDAPPPVSHCVAAIKLMVAAAWNPSNPSGLVSLIGPDQGSPSYLLAD